MIIEGVQETDIAVCATLQKPTGRLSEGETWLHNSCPRCSSTTLHNIIKRLAYAPAQPRQHLTLTLFGVVNPTAFGRLYFRSVEQISTLHLSFSLSATVCLNQVANRVIGLGALQQDKDVMRLPGDWGQRLPPWNHQQALLFAGPCTKREEEQSTKRSSFNI